MKKILSGFLAFCLVFSIFSTNFITKAEDNAKKIILKVDTSKISNENVDTYLKKGEYDKVKEIEQRNKESFAANQTLTIVEMGDVFLEYLIGGVLV